MEGTDMDMPAGAAGTDMNAHCGQTAAGVAGSMDMKGGWMADEPVDDCSGTAYDRWLGVAVRVALLPVDGGVIVHDVRHDGRDRRPLPRPGAASVLTACPRLDDVSARSDGSGHHATYGATRVPNTAQRRLSERGSTRRHVAISRKQCEQAT